jgi:hypothetical protein
VSIFGEPEYKIEQKFSEYRIKTSKQTMFIKLFLFSLFATGTTAFLPRMSSSLQNILASRAIVTTFGEHIVEEVFTNSNIIQQVLLDHSKSQLNLDLFYLVILAIVLNNAKTSIGKKLTDVSVFSDVQKKTNIFVLVLLIIFNRNVENAI